MTPEPALPLLLVAAVLAPAGLALGALTLASWALDRVLARDPGAGASARCRAASPVGVLSTARAGGSYDARHAADGAGAGRA